MNSVPFEDTTPKFKPINWLNLKFMESSCLAYAWFHTNGSAGKEPDPSFLSILLSFYLITGFIVIGISNRGTPKTEKFFRGACRWFISSALGLIFGWFLFLNISTLDFFEFIKSTIAFTVLAAVYTAAINIPFKFRVANISNNEKSNNIVSGMIAITLLFFAFSVTPEIMNWISHLS